MAMEGLRFHEGFAETKVSLFSVQLSLPKSWVDASHNPLANHFPAPNPSRETRLA